MSVTDDAASDGEKMSLNSLDRDLASEIWTGDGALKFHQALQKTQTGNVADHPRGDRLVRESPRNEVPS